MSDRPASYGGTSISYVNEPLVQSSEPPLPRLVLPTKQLSVDGDNAGEDDDDADDDAEQQEEQPVQQAGASAHAGSPSAVEGTSLWRRRFRGRSNSSGAGIVPKLTLSAQLSSTLSSALPRSSSLRNLFSPRSPRSQQEPTNKGPLSPGFSPTLNQTSGPPTPTHISERPTPTDVCANKDCQTRLGFMGKKNICVQCSNAFCAQHCHKLFRIGTNGLFDPSAKRQRLCVDCEKIYVAGLQRDSLLVQSGIGLRYHSTLHREAAGVDTEATPHDSGSIPVIQIDACTTESTDNNPNEANLVKAVRKLSVHLNTRPAREDLEGKNIIGSEDAAENFVTQVKLRRDSTSSALEAMIARRPSIQELFARNILLKFSEEVYVYHTHDNEEYDRRADKSWTRLTRDQKASMKAEINALKGEMEVHEASRYMTRFHT